MIYNSKNSFLQYVLPLLIEDLLAVSVCSSLYIFHFVDRAVLLFISSQNVVVRTPTLVSEHKLY